MKFEPMNPAPPVTKRRIHSALSQHHGVGSPAQPHVATSEIVLQIERAGTHVTDSRAYWRSRSVLVTGATGLVGSHLVATLLASGADVAVVLRDHDRRSELFRSGNIRNVAVTGGELESVADIERAIAESGASVVFHLGAQTLVGVGLTA